MINSDQWVIFITFISMTLLLPLLIAFLTTERFYDHDINRWRPGVNLPALRGAQGKKIDFGKFQKDVRLYSFAFIQAILFGILPFAFVAEESPDFTWVMIISMSWIGVVSIGLIIFTFKTFPSWTHKYIKGKIKKA